MVETILQETEITSTKPQVAPEQLVVHDVGEYSMLFDTAKFNQAWRVAKAFADSKMVPAHFQGNTAGVLVVLHMSTRMGLDPFMVLQNTYMVAGRPGMEAKLVIALVNARGPFKGPIQWEVSGEGDSRKWVAYAIHRETGERCEAELTWEMVKKEGWSVKNGSKWLSLPGLMGRYRSATFLARLYCPEVIMGLSTVDELQDSIIDLEAKNLPPIVTLKDSSTEKLKEDLKAKRGRPPKAPESPSVAPKEEDRGEGQGSADKPPMHIQGIQEDTLQAILKAQEATGIDISLPYYERSISPKILLSELDEESGQAILAWYQQQ